MGIEDVLIRLGIYILVNKESGVEPSKFYSHILTLQFIRLKFNSFELILWVLKNAVFLYLLKNIDSYIF